MKVEDNMVQFDIEGFPESFYKTTYVELIDLFCSKYAPWTSSNMDAKNQYLNRIFLDLAH